MLEMHPARAIAPRRLITRGVVALSALVLAVACNDGDAVRGIVSGGGAGTSAGGASGAPLAGAAGSTSVEVEAGAGGAPPSDTEAGAGGESEAGAAGEPAHTVQTTHCAPGGTPFVVGNYADAAGNRLLVRSAPRTATFAIVPAGAANPARPPQLFAVDRLCAREGANALIAKDASSSYRVDYIQTGAQFSICLSAPVATLDAALALPPADASRAANTGCAGKPFTVYTVEAL